jgi:hypothetical protein
MNMSRLVTVVAAMSLVVGTPTAAGATEHSYRTFSLHNNKGVPYTVQLLAVIDPASGRNVPAGLRWVAANFRLTNTGNGLVSGEALNMTMALDADSPYSTKMFGNPYGVVLTNPPTCKELLNYRVSPGQSLTGCVVFGMPIGSGVEEVLWGPTARRIGVGASGVISGDKGDALWHVSDSKGFTTTSPSTTTAVSATEELQAWVDETLNSDESTLVTDMDALGSCQVSNSDDLAMCEEDGYVLQTAAWQFGQGPAAPNAGVETAWNTCLSDSANIGNDGRSENIGNEQSWVEQLASDTARLKAALAARGITDPTL